MGAFLDRMREGLGQETPLSEQEPFQLETRRFADRMAHDAPKGNAFASRINQQIETETATEKQGVFFKALEIFQRGQFATAGFTDVLVNESTATIGDALAIGVSEFFTPKRKLSYADVIRRANPEWATRNRTTAAILGFVLDVGLDPLTYMSFGTSALGAKVLVKGAERALNKSGTKLLKQAVLHQQNLFATGAQASENARRMVGIVAQANPQLLKSEGFIAAFKIPFGSEVQLIPESLRKLVNQVTGMAALGKAVSAMKNTRVMQLASKAFIRKEEFPRELVRGLNRIEHGLTQAQHDVKDETIKLFRGISPKGREKIGRAATDIDDATRQFEKALGRAVNPEEGAKVKLHVLEVAKLNDKEMAALSGMTQRFQEVGMLEKEAGLLQEMLSNYNPRIYEGIENSKEYLRNRKIIGGQDPTKARKFATSMDAEFKGFNLTDDAAKLFAYRVLLSKRLLEAKRSKELLKQFNIKNGSTELKALQHDFKFVGDSFDPEFDNEVIGAMMSGYDNLLNFSRKAATIAKPNFGVRQLFSNTFQVFLGQGAKGLKAFDLRGLQDTAKLLDNMTTPQKMKAFVLKSPLGDVYTGPEIIDLLKADNIVTDLAVGGVAQSKRNVSSAVRQDRWVNGFSEATGVPRGYLSVMGNVMAFWRWPARVENFARTGTYVNALRMGHTPAQAKAITNKALFDYSKGLTAFESALLNRVAFFYKFNRFVIPLLATTAVKTPGRIGNASKALELGLNGAAATSGVFENLFHGVGKFEQGQELTSSERQVVPDWIFEQPSAFAGFDDAHRAVFKTFNNFTPMDILSISASGEDGKLQLKRTAEKVFMAALAPMIKIPIEIAANKSFFTGRVIQREDSKGEGLQTSKKVLGGVGAITATLDGALPKFVKDAIGWEIFSDRLTGEEKVYINPWLAHVAFNTAPVLKNYIQVADARLSPTETVTNALFGVGTFDFDLATEAKYRFMEDERIIRDKEIELKRLRLQGRDESFIEEFLNLQELLGQIMRDRKRFNEGGGITGGN